MTPMTPGAANSRTGSPSREAKNWAEVGDGHRGDGAGDAADAADDDDDPALLG